MTWSPNQIEWRPVIKHGDLLHATLSKLTLRPNETLVERVTLCGMTMINADFGPVGDEVNGLTCDHCMFFFVENFRNRMEME